MVSGATYYSGLPSGTETSVEESTEGEGRTEPWRFALQLLSVFAGNGDMAPGIMHQSLPLIELNWTGPTGLDSFTHNGGLQGDQSLTTSFSQLVSTPPVTGLPDKSGQFCRST